MKRFYRYTRLKKSLNISTIFINYQQRVIAVYINYMVRDQARVVRSCFMAVLLPRIWNIYEDMFQWRWFRRSIDVIFYCFREKSPASITKVPAAILNPGLIWHDHITSYLTELCVFWWLFTSEDTLWCLSWGSRISLVFNPEHIWKW